MAVVNTPLPELRNNPHWSYSRINSLVSHCSLQWAFRYVYHQDPEFTPVSLIFGSAFHRTAACVHARIRDGQEVTRKEATEMFTDYFQDMIPVSEPEVKFKDSENQSDLERQGQAMAVTLLENIDRSRKIIGLSVSFSAVLRNRFGEQVQRPLIGEYDMLAEEENGNTVITDWKTSARRWPENRVKTCLQATCYLYGMMENEAPSEPPGFEYAVVTKTKVPAFQTLSTVRTEDDFIRLGEIVRVLERRINSEAFLPDNSSNDCANCPYPSACRSWHHVRNGRVFTPGSIRSA